MIRRAWRRLLATPVFTIFAVLSLALGVGVTTAIYAVIVPLTRTGLDVPHADRIGVVTGASAFNDGRSIWQSVMSRSDFEDARRAVPEADAAAVSAPFLQSLVTESATENVIGEAVNGRYFSMLRVAPRYGRVIQPADDLTPTRVVVLGHQFWRTRLAADEGVVGRTLRLGGEPFEIVGVADESFSGLNYQLQAPTAVFVPLASTTMFPNSAAPGDVTDRRRRQLTVLIDLSSPADTSRLSAAVLAAGRRLDEAYPLDFRRTDTSGPVIRPRNWAVSTLADVDDRFGAALSRGRLIIMTIVGLVLVVACTNLANLVLARGSTRRHELAVRRALGASRTRLILEELSETMLLAVMGGVGAVIVARLLMNAFGSVSLPISETLVVQLAPSADMGTWLLAAVSLVGSLMVFGIAPAVQLTRTDLRTALGTEAGSTGELKWRTKRILISVQVMISLAFFLIAAFAVRIALFEQARPSGVDVERLAAGSFNFRLPPWTDVTARDAVDRVLAVAASEKAIERAAVSSGLPFGTQFTPSAAMTTPEKPFMTGRSDYPDALLLAATPAIFDTLGVEIVRGRGFEATDTAGSAAIVVLSELAARHAFGSTDVLGRELHLRYSGNSAEPERVSTVTVVGIAADTDTVQRLSRRTGVAYLPLAQHYEPWLMLVARTSREPADLVPMLRAVVKRAAPDLALDRPGPAALLVNGPFVLVDVISRAAGGLALLAMALAMAGLFGVMSHLVSRRTREMGVRLALGAQPRQIRRLVIGDGLAPVGGGLVMGLIIGFLVRWLMRSAYNAPLTATDAIVFVLAPLPILVAAVIACYWPAERASRVEPNVALRDL